ncbi:RNA-binding protein 39 [Sesamum angolense]|uniref:RNA-binding protein 39 n=1 Tax=Sesamum angolense TaxID=2727404 RepID=A0AAE1T525_9LAMI|nr:RNA-binding protein 39 [Sesamum angolense]
MFNRRFKDKKEAVEPEADPERDQRTVFAYQMPLKATERDVFEFFSQAGKVRDVKLIMDRNSRIKRSWVVSANISSRSGLAFITVASISFNSGFYGLSVTLVLLHDFFVFCSIVIEPVYADDRYIEFYDAMSVPMAIALSGHLFLGQPVMVKPSEAEKNLVQSNTSAGGAGVAGPYGATDRKLYVGNLHFNMTEFQLKQIFEAFGPVELVQLPTDPETGHCKGFGFVQFAQLEHAKAAQSLNGKLEIAGRTIKVSSVTDHVGVQDSGAKTADFDDDDGGGLHKILIKRTGITVVGEDGSPTRCLSLKLRLIFDPDALNAQSRAMLMAKLDRSGIASRFCGEGLRPSAALLCAGAQSGLLPSAGLRKGALCTVRHGSRSPWHHGSRNPLRHIVPVVGPLGVPALNGAVPSQQAIAMPINPTSVLPTPVLPAQSDPEFDLDIRDDVQEECSKYGRVKHIHVDKNSAGYVYLRFESVEAASRAQQAMHKRCNLTSMMPNSKAQPERVLLQTKHEWSMVPLPRNASASSWIVWKSLAVV